LFDFNSLFLNFLFFASFQLLIILTFSINIINKSIIPFCLS